MKKSFTLIEILLVVVIIGVLASLVVPRLAGRAERARKVAAQSDVNANIPGVLDMYEMDMGQFPQTLEGLIVEPSDGDNWQGPYLKKLPKDPWGRSYQYRSPGEHNKDYDLSSSGRDGIAGNEDDVKNWE